MKYETYLIYYPAYSCASTVTFWCCKTFRWKVSVSKTTNSQVSSCCFKRDSKDWM